jgi:hypothetical protein
VPRTTGGPDQNEYRLSSPALDNRTDGGGTPSHWSAQLVDGSHAQRGPRRGIFKVTALPVHHTGAKFGQEPHHGQEPHQPVADLSLDGRDVGSLRTVEPTDPGWYYNRTPHAARRTPHGRIEVGTEMLDVAAGETTEEGRERLLNTIGRAAFPQISS